MWLTITGILFLILVYIGYLSLDSTKKEENIPRLLVAVSTGKSRQLQPKTGDTSLVTEFKRRMTIKTVGSLNPSKIKETRTSSGSLSGYVETYRISGINNIPICNPYDINSDGGDETFNN